MGSIVVEYLKDPHLVAKVQEFFGVRVNYDVKLQKIQKSNKQNDNDIKSDYVTTNSNSDHISSSKEKRNGFNSYKKNHTNQVTNPEQNDNILDQNLDLCNAKNGHVTITNYFWYYLFLFGTELGDEIFYSSFIPFWFWNIDSAVGRRVVLVWAIIMTIGQASKDIICWPRPACPPAIRLQSKWSQEYGMPSTHAMIGITIPFSIVLFTMNRYIYSFPIGFTIALLWCTLVSMSRLYLGMHTVLDVIVGLLLAICLMVPLIPLVDFMDYYFVTNIYALLLLIAISIATIIYYPSSDKWTPTRGDTSMVVSVTAGVHTGSWLNYVTGALTPSSLPPPYKIIWPTYPMFGCLILRTMIGFCCVIATKAISKSVSYATICAILKVNSKELMKSENNLENKNKILVDLVYKYLACFAIGVNTAYLLPNMFTMIGIERPTFYTEM